MTGAVVTARVRRGGPLPTLSRRWALFGVVALLMGSGSWLAGGTIGTHPPSPGASRASSAPGPADRVGAAGSPGPSSAVPAARIGRAAVHPAASIIDPLAGYSREPAPMGIADFGVTGTGSGATAYEYSTPSFEASASIGSLRLTVGSGRTEEEVAAFELNAMLVLQLSGVNYTYWIQNGLHVNTTSREFTIGGAYVWNFSASGARLTTGELRGNASSVLASDTYYFIPGCSAIPGQCSTLSWPTTLLGRINASSVDGVPEVAYQYDLGSGWVTYDTVSFLHLSGASVTGFTVDGFEPTPYASTLFYDAEWDWVAAGGGETGVDQGSDLQMSLSYWNGHNYQAVPSAWDFGGDTGETSSNVSVAVAPSAATGALVANVSSGTGSLGVLYNASEAGSLNVSSPDVPTGTLDLDGASVPFSGGYANLTLGAGTYTISLDGYSNATATVTIVAGSTRYLDLGGAGRTTFEETGLPSGTLWGVSLDGIGIASTASALSLALPNGTYSIAYRAVPGFLRNASAPAQLTVPSAPVTIAWSAFTFGVPVNETGLPNDTAWWINASGEVVRGSGPSLLVAAPNGSTAFTVGSAYEFLATPASGTIEVTAGSAVPVEIQFAYRPTFLDGTLSPANATLTIGGAAVAVSDGQFNDSVIPGRYTLVASAPGYLSQTIQANATAGNVTVERITLSATPAQHNTGGPGPISTSGGGAGFDLLAGIGIAAAAVVVIAAVVITRRRPRSP